MDMPPRTSVQMPYTISDLPEYTSPITGKPVRGRADRREDLARSGCVEIDPPKQREMRTEKWAKRTSLPFKG